MAYTFLGETRSIIQAMISRTPFLPLYDRLTRNKQRTLTVIIFLGACVLVYCTFATFTLFRDYGRQSQLEFFGPKQFLPLDEALELCADHNLSAFPYRTRPRKVYDLFLVNTELDWLEIRLNELDPHVDYFVILEATNTFSGNPKSLHFKENYGLFENFGPKIIYHALDIEHRDDSGTWEREAYTRNALFDAIFPSLLGRAAPEPGDVILVSDIDEIPRPNTLKVLRNCNFPERTTLRSRFFYYSFQWLHVGEDWFHPQATYYQGLDKTLRPEDLRRGGDSWDLWNASWHCSSCFSTVAEMAHKIESFSHREWDKSEFKEPAEIVRRVRNGLDLFDREGENYEKIDPNNDIPEYLKLNSKRFNYILDRDPPNANFRDYQVQGRLP